MVDPNTRLFLKIPFLISCSLSFDLFSGLKIFLNLSISFKIPSNFFDLEAFLQTLMSIASGKFHHQEKIHHINRIPESLWYDILESTAFGDVDKSLDAIDNLLPFDVNDK